MNDAASSPRTRGWSGAALTIAGLSRSSEMIAGWMRANLVSGVIEAVAAGLVLSWLGVPAPLVWAAFTLFAEFVPKLGPYVMATPPILVAFSVSPGTALWVLVFYVALNEIMGDLVTPYVRGRSMHLHPFVLVFAAVALSAAFGLLGALVATPLAAVLTAFTQELVLSRRPPADDFAVAAAVEAVLDRR
jgi:predicted PurR-regulated permease PerM